MQRILRLILLLLPFTTAAQPIDPTAYRYPIEGVLGLYSANFGEVRPGHFHAGIDIKTEMEEGKPLVATMDGYISRIAIQAGGYGRALYLTLENGTTAVYAHLQRFADPIEEYVRSERYRRKANAVDLWPQADRFPVKQGDRIGYSGNSGSSSGPHLHYEIRNSADQSPRNLVRDGIIRPVDSLPPRFMKLHYVEIDTLENGIPMRRAMESYAVVRSENGRYRLTRNGPLPVGRKGYFIAEVTDRRNGVHNTFAVYRLRSWLDGKPYFEFRMDRFTYAISRTSDAVSCYPLQLGSRNEVLRMAQLDGAPDRFYPTLVERGLVRTAAGERRLVEMELEDDCGNRSSLRFEVVGRAEEFVATPPADSLLVPLFRNRATTLELPDFTAHIPAGALYESQYAKAEAGLVAPVDSGTVVLSPAYRIFAEPRTPLFKPITIAIRTHVPKALQGRTMLALRNRNGRAAAAGGRYKEGEVSVSTRSVGDYFVVADTLAPVITPLFTRTTPLTKERKLAFRVADNFSGVASWRLEIDQEWVPCDRYPSRGQLIWHIDRPATGQTHRARLTLRDGVGNEQCWEGEFTW